ncbi:MAG: hypothetical protein INF91_04815 [Alphaproteobacteria bacterium]|nr:hypothetical protein [Alphaproteobacteria bacterium]
MQLALALISLLGAGGGLAAFFATVRHFRSQSSADRKVDTDAEVSLATSLAALNETLTRGVFEQNAAHQQAIAQAHEKHAEDMARERQHCANQMSSMGKRLDDVQRQRTHDLKNFMASIMSLAQLMKLPADKVTELARTFEPIEAQIHNEEEPVG